MLPGSMETMFGPRKVCTCGNVRDIETSSCSQTVVSAEADQHLRCSEAMKQTKDLAHADLKDCALTQLYGDIFFRQVGNSKCEL